MEFSHNWQCCRRNLLLLRQAIFVLVVMQMVGVSKLGVHSFHAPSIALHHHQHQQKPLSQKNFDGSKRRIFNNLYVISPDQIHDLLISSTSMQHGLADSISNHVTNHHHHITTEVNTIISAPRTISEMTQWISDATAAVDTKQPDDGGWWKAYINIFKSILTFVHSTIDGPLRSVGIEQTWGVSIFLFTAIIRSSLLPLSIQQSKSAEYMKALRPYMSEIKVKFKGNDQAIQRATGKLIEDAKQNPLSGCFLSLVQIPVFLGLYRGVRLLALDNQLNEPFLWIPSLEGPVSPPDYTGMGWILNGWTAATDGGFPYVPQLGWETTLAFLIMPVLLILLQSTTMTVLQPPMDENLSDEEKKTMESTQNIFKFLPLLIGFFALQVPAGLTIYWFTSNIFTLTQTLGVRAYFKANPPKIELPDYWESALGENSDDMTPEERRKISEAGIRVGPTFNDLIDESKFHSIIERPPMRSESAAWQRALSTVSSTTHSEAELPIELQEWVQNSKIGAHHQHASSAIKTIDFPINDDSAAATAGAKTV